MVRKSGSARTSWAGKHRAGRRLRKLAVELVEKRLLLAAEPWLLDPVGAVGFHQAGPWDYAQSGVREDFASGVSGEGRGEFWARVESPLTFAPFFSVATYSGSRIEINTTSDDPSQIGQGVRVRLSAQMVSTQWHPDLQGHVNYWADYNTGATSGTLIQGSHVGSWVPPGVDRGTFEFDARIGTPFQVSFDIYASLEGPQVTASGSNTLVDFSYAVELATAPNIKITFATLDDSDTVRFNFSATYGEIDQFQVGVYRSADEEFDAGDQQVGDLVTIPAVSSGSYTVQADLPIDPAHPYVLVVADPGNEIIESDETDNVGHFRKWVIGAVTHGFQPKGELTNWDAHWAPEMADKLKSVAGYDEAFAFSWLGISNYPAPGLTTWAGIQMWSEVNAKRSQLRTREEFSPGDVIDVHWIGHSRGAVVISEALQFDSGMGKGYTKVTLLDPHPARNLAAVPYVHCSFDVLSRFGWLLYTGTLIFQRLARDPEIDVGIADDAEVFYQTTDHSLTPTLLERWMNLWGETVSGARNVPWTGVGTGHGEVPLRYMNELIVQARATVGDRNYARTVAGSESDVDLLYPDLIDDRRVAEVLVSQLERAKAAYDSGGMASAAARLNEFIATIRTEIGHIDAQLAQDLAASAQLFIDSVHATVQLGTPLSLWRSGVADSPLIRPQQPDATQFVEITNYWSAPFSLSETRVNAPGVSVSPNLTGDPADDIVLAPGQTQRFDLTYTPELPNTGSETTTRFDIANGLVIVSAEGGALNVRLSGRSTFNADISYDGIVNLEELGVLNTNYGRRCGDADWDPSADINGDCSVNLGDLGLLNAQFGRNGIGPVIVASLANDAGDRDDDRVTSDPAVAGSVTDNRGVTVFRGGLDGATIDSFFDLLGDLQPDGSFHLAAARMEDLYGGPLPQGPHTLHLHAEDTDGNEFYLYDVPFVLQTADVSSPDTNGPGDLRSAVSAGSGDPRRAVLRGPLPAAASVARSGLPAEANSGLGDPATVVIGADLLEDNEGVPGDPIPDNRVTIGESFFVEIVAEDIREPSAGLVGLSLDVGWDAGVLTEIDAPFDPADPSSPLVTPGFPLFRGAMLDNPLGRIDELRGGSLPAAGLGQALGNGASERFSLLRFRALDAASGTPLVIELGSGGASLADGVSDLVVAFVLPTIEVTGDPTPWQNTPPWDVNDDGEVHPDDVLRLVNDINARDVRSLPVPPIAPDVPPPYLDPSGDNWISPLDVLMVINYINQHPTAVGETMSPTSGEGEESPAMTSAIVPGSSAWTALWHASRIWLSASPGNPSLVSRCADCEPRCGLLLGEAGAARQPSADGGVAVAWRQEQAFAGNRARGILPDPSFRRVRDGLSLADGWENLLSDIALDIAAVWDAVRTAAAGIR